MSEHVTYNTIGALAHPKVAKKVGNASVSSRLSAALMKAYGKKKRGRVR